MVTINSPNLCPTIFSFITKLLNFFPLKTNNEWTYITESQSLTNLIKIVGNETFDGTSYFEFTDNSEVYPYIIKHWFAKKGATYLLKTDDTTINQGGLS